MTVSSSLKKSPNARWWNRDCVCSEMMASFLYVTQLYHSMHLKDRLFTFINASSSVFTADISLRFYNTVEGFESG